LLGDAIIAYQNPELPIYITKSLPVALLKINDQAIETVSDTLPSRSYPLTLARIWLRFEKEGIVNFERRLISFGESIKKEYKGRAIEAPLKESRNGIRDTAQQILWYYVRHEGEKLGEYINTYFSSTVWLKPKPKPPSNVEPVMDILLGELTTRKSYLIQVFNILSGAASLDFLSQVKDPPTPTSFGTIELDPTSIFTAIIKVCFRTFLECTRLVTFFNCGYQQIQLNLHYLKMALVHYKLIDDINSLAELVEDILISAHDRTNDPNPLDSSIVDKICNQKFKNYILENPGIK